MTYLWWEYKLDWAIGTLFSLFLACLYMGVESASPGNGRFVVAFVFVVGLIFYLTPKTEARSVKRGFVALMLLAYLGIFVLGFIANWSVMATGAMQITVIGLLYAVMHVRQKTLAYVLPIVPFNLGIGFTPVDGWMFMFAWILFQAIVIFWPARRARKYRAMPA